VKELVEMMSIGGVTAIAVDLCWLAHDIYVADTHRPGLWIVGGGLLIALGVSAYGLFHYHRDNVKQLLRGRLEHKLHMNKMKQRKARRVV
jgi:hypothetical protein